MYKIFVQELPPFLLEPSFPSSDDSYYQKGDEVDGALPSRGGRTDSYVNALHRYYSSSLSSFTSSFSSSYSSSSSSSGIR